MIKISSSFSEVKITIECIRIYKALEITGQQKPKDSFVPAKFIHYFDDWVLFILG